MSSDSEADVELNNLEDETIMNKYKVASEIVHRVAKELIKKCEHGSSIYKLCVYGDEKIIEETAKIYKKDKDMKKGIAFPTCIMKNNIVCNYSPLVDNPEDVLNKGDLVKLDIGVHVDGYPGVLCHTFVVGTTKDEKVTGKKADAIIAAYNCAEASLRLIKPGKNSKDFTEPLSGIAADFGCKVIENCLVHGIEKDIYSNLKSFFINPTDDEAKKKKQDFELNQVWIIDVLVTTGEGKVKERETKTTVYKRNFAADIYNLKLKASRQFFSEVCNRCLTYPFTIRSFADQAKAKIAAVECANHALVDPLPVMYEKDNEVVAQFKYTVLLTKNGPMKLTGLPIDTSLYKSEHKLQNAAGKLLLAESLKNKKKPGGTSGGDS